MKSSRKAICLPKVKRQIEKKTRLQDPLISVEIDTSMDFMPFTVKPSEAYPSRLHLMS